MVLMLSKVVGIGIETADMLVHEVLARDLRDRRAVARFPRAHGLARREWREAARKKGLSKAGNARVRRGMIEFAWRFLQHQKESALAVVQKPRRSSWSAKKTMIVALARKLLHRAVASGPHG